MKKRIATTAAAVGSAALLAVAAAVTSAPSAEAGLVTSCNGYAENTTVKTNLIVPEGANCELVNVNVKGDIVIKKDATLIANKGTYQGKVNIGENAWLDMIDGRVNKDVNSDGGNAYIVASDLRGNYNASGGDFEFDTVAHQLTQTNLAGSINANTPATFDIQSSTIEGPATSQGTGFFSITDSVLKDSLTVENAENFPYICKSEVYGDARYSNNPDGPVIGSYNYVGCTGMNYFGGNLTVEANGPSEVSNNIVAGDLSGEGNSYVWGQDNRVRGQVSGQFVDLKPEPSYKPQGKAESKADKPSADKSKKAAEERRDEARAKAKAAGKAF